jgi:hypothetical protein
VSSSNQPSKRPNRVKARSAQRPNVTAKRPTAKRRAAQKSKAPEAKPAPASPRNPPSPRARPAIRLPGSASSRLTIKPGSALAPAAPFELSTKRRPSGPRLLSQVELDEDEVLIDDFDATLDGVMVRITAVLERTCVYVDRNGDRRLARKNELWVEADKLPVRRRGVG